MQLFRKKSIADAINQADIVVLAIYFDPIKEFFKTYATYFK